MRLIRLGLVFPLLALSLACSTTTPGDPLAARRDGWVASMGGVAPAGSEQVLVDQAMARLHRCVRVVLLDTLEPGAFAWPDGRIFVSRGLVRLLTADELSAALAHELGHLIIDGRLQAPGALAGSNAALGIERRADGVARSLLGSVGLPVESLSYALAKLRDGLPERDPRRAAIEERIQCR